MYSNLAQEGKIGKLTVKNRIVMSPMGIGLAELDGTPSDAMIAFYEARAKGGAGIVIPEITRINDVTGAGLLRQLSVTKDRHIAPLARLANAVQKHGSRLFIQLHHPGRETMSSLIGGQPVVAPSAIPCKLSQQKTRALETAEVKEIIQQFINGALRAQKAGCDGVELHGAHGYLINQFLSPYTNKREDEYGGSFENRLRFVSEIIAGIRAACGEDFPISVRLSVDEYLSATGVTEDYIHLEDGIKIAVALEKLGIDVLNVSCGIYETGVVSVEPISYPQGWRTEMIKAVKAAVKIPVIAVDLIREPAFADKLLEKGVMDFAALGRGFLADQDWGAKAFEGREGEIRRCISCLRCFESLGAYNMAGLPAECAVNPRMARELQYGDLVRDVSGHRAVVVGGGPAGLAAAETLAMRGVGVTLLEKQDRLGGQLLRGENPPGKERLDWVIQYYEARLAKYGVDVRLGRAADKALIDSLAPDAVVVATGAVPLVPDLPGAKGENVCGVAEVLEGRSGLEGKKVVLVGAGMTGLETAEYLAAKGGAVTVVDMLKKPAPGEYRTNVADITGRLKKYGVEYKLGHRLLEITAGGAVVEPVDGGEKETLAAEGVVLAVGWTPDTALYGELKGAYETKLIGDAKRVGKIAQAVRKGFECGSKLFVAEAKAPSFLATKEEMENHGKLSLLGDQEGVYLAYMTDPAKLARLLPPPLKPYPMPIVTLSVMHVRGASYAEEYYEAILGCFAMNGDQPGQYSIAMVLGGPGAEMATYMGRDKVGIPKKLGAEFSLRREGDCVRVAVARKGTQLVDARLTLGETNSPLLDTVYQGPKPGGSTTGFAMYYLPGMKTSKLIGTVLEYTHHKWEPGLCSLKTFSSPDDPWGELPVSTVIGGAWAHNDLLMAKSMMLANTDTKEVYPWLLTPRFDRTTFMEKYDV